VESLVVSPTQGGELTRDAQRRNKGKLFCPRNVIADVQNLRNSFISLVWPLRVDEKRERTKILSPGVLSKRYAAGCFDDFSSNEADLEIKRRTLQSIQGNTSHAPLSAIPPNLRQNHAPVGDPRDIANLSPTLAHPPGTTLSPSSLLLLPIDDICPIPRDLVHPYIRFSSNIRSFRD
jgi:hypothetical protein